MTSATANGISIINFGMGSANAATIIDLLGAINPKAVLSSENAEGSRRRMSWRSYSSNCRCTGEGTSDDYMLPEVPALPAFSLQKAVSTTIRDMDLDYWTGTVYTTNRRVWEHDDKFKEYLRQTRCMGIDMETATLFVAGFYNEIPTGALLLVSDQPMVPEGVKTDTSDKKVTTDFVDRHIQIGIASLRQLMNNGLTVKHLRF